MKSIPITKSFDYSKIDNLMGEARLTDGALTEINKLLSQGVIMDFAISFTGTPDENGVYQDAELVGLSMVPRRKNEVQ